MYVLYVLYTKWNEIETVGTVFFRCWRTVGQTQNLVEIHVDWRDTKLVMKETMDAKLTGHHGER